MFTVYGDILSGNCYKIKLLCSLLQLEHRWQHVDILQQQTHSGHFLALNPNGKIPLLQFENGDTLWESNAILNYLAQGSVFLPDDNFMRAKILQWQFFEQYSHEPYIAVARFIALYLKLPKERLDEFKSKQEGGYKALAVMEKQLQENPFLTGEQYTIADISLYAYTHVADEGGFDLQAYPAIRAWLKRINQHPLHTTMSSHADER